MSPSKLFDRGAAAVGEQRHRPCGYVAEVHYANGSIESFPVNCPICLGRPAGYTEKGKPIYKGGRVLVCDDGRRGNRDGAGNPLPNATARCTCFIGERFRVSLPSFTSYPDTHQFPEGRGTSITIHQRPPREA